MKLISKKDKITEFRQRWDKQYDRYADDKFIGCGKNRHTIAWHREQFAKLDFNTCTEQDIAEIIGNDSWTSNRCDECGEDSQVVIELGEEPDYESATVHICPACLKLSINLAASNVHPKAKTESEPADITE